MTKTLTYSISIYSTENGHLLNLFLIPVLFEWSELRRLVDIQVTKCQGDLAES